MTGRLCRLLALVALWGGRLPKDRHWRCTCLQGALDHLRVLWGLQEGAAGGRCSPGLSG
jgi:hypothetical protein